MFYLSFPTARQGVSPVDSPFNQTSLTPQSVSPSLATRAVLLQQPLSSVLAVTEGINLSLPLLNNCSLFPIITNVHDSVWPQGRLAPGSQSPAQVNFHSVHITGSGLSQLCHGRQPKPLPLGPSKKISFLSPLCPSKSSHISRLCPFTLNTYSKYDSSHQIVSCTCHRITKCHLHGSSIAGTSIV